MRGEFVDLSGARLYYYAAGTRGAGDPIVLIHGFPTSSHLWGDLVPRLPTGHRVVVVDLLGFGRSDRPVGSDVSVGGHAKLVTGLLDNLRITRACIVGHGFGGCVAQSLATLAPKRVSHMCLVSSSTPDEPVPSELGIGPSVLAGARHLPSAVLVTLLRRNLLRGYLDRERGTRSIDLYLRPFHGSDGRDALVRHLDSARGGTIAIEDTPSVRTTVVAGDEDPFTSLDVARRLHASIPNSSLRILVGHSHFLPEEAPNAVADEIADLLSSS